MFIRAYLRASTEDQFADRAKEMLEQFVQERGHKIASYYRENISGTKLDRPELGRLLMDSHRNDILLVEQIDRLTRLSNSDWMTLKKQIEQHELRIVSLDVPTSWQALSEKDPSQADPITRAVITAINNMLIDLMAAMSHKDWLSRRQRQQQGIKRAHSLGNTGANRQTRNDTRRCCTTDRLRNSVYGRQQKQPATVLLRFVGYRRLIKSPVLIESALTWINSRLYNVLSNLSSEMLCSSLCQK